MQIGGGQQAEETVFYGTSPHNCGGSACVLAAHVAGGRIVRLATDERPVTKKDENGIEIDPQFRGCVRCRSKKEWFYRTDRLLYPLKQTKKRGDLSGFVRISWKQACQEIANETKRIKDAYGASSFHRFYSTGDGAAYPRSREISADILRLLGGEYVYHDDYSYPSWYTAGTFTLGNAYQSASSAPDLANTKLIILWSCNASEMIVTCNASWFITQARDHGVPVVAVDQRLSKTATTLSTGKGNVPNVITPVSGTDAALICAILNHLITKHIEAKTGGDIWSDSAYLRPRHIAKYIHGFFDNLPANGEGKEYSYPYKRKKKDTSLFNVTTPDTDKDGSEPVADVKVDKTSYPVPDGASYSAYIFGSDNKLVTAGLNKKASIYPNQIGYNVSDAEFPQYKWKEDGTLDATETAQDVLFGKYAPCYGQVNKTPEWAELITGVPAQTIKDFAELLAANFGQLSLLHCGGFQRNTEGEQNPRSLFILAAALGAFGKPGATFGNPSPSIGSNADYLPKFSNANNLFADANLAEAVDKGLATFTDKENKEQKSPNVETMVKTWKLGSRYDAGKLTVPAISKKDAAGTFPVFMWQDAIERGTFAGTAADGKSRWNHPGIKNGPAIKLIYNFGGNCVVNQCGDYNLTTKILSLPNTQHPKEDLQYPNRQYQLELLVTSDHFMTASCQWSDYVLPAAMAFERSFYKGSGDGMLYSPKAVDAPAGVISDFHMTMGIAEALGSAIDPKKIATPTSTVASDSYSKYEDYLRQAYNEDKLLESKYSAPVADPALTFEEFKKRGIVTSSLKGRTNITLKAFYDDPAKSPIATPTGKIEAYSQGMVEYYEARGFRNSDSNITLPNDGSITTKGGKDQKTGRYVYPIPMYIPLVEGRHACDGDDSTVPDFDGTAASEITVDETNHGATKHPDLTGSNAKDYKYRLHTWHMQYRSHSTLNSNAYLNECYKLNSAGEPAFYALDRGQAKVYGSAAAVCDNNLYEPVFVSPKTAEAINLPKPGAVVVIYNDRGAIYAYAKSSPLVQDGEIMIGQGAWASPSDDETCIVTYTYNDESVRIVHKVDVGGCANTLTSIRPSRICQGMTLANDCKVGIKVK